MTLGRNLLKNGAATGLQKGVRTVEQLFLVPFFISAWGLTHYGEWITLTAIPAVLSLSDLGLGSAAANTFVLRYIAGDKIGAASVAKAGLIMLSLAVIVLATVLFAVVGLLPEFSFLQKSSVPSSVAATILTTLMLARLISFFIPLFEAFYRSARHAALGINLLTAQAALKIIVSIVLLRLGGDMVSIAISDLVVTFCSTVLYAGIAYRVLPEIDWTAESDFRKEIRTLVKKGVAYLASPVWQAIFFQGTTLIVRGGLGPESVALFNTVRTLCRSVNQLFSMINGTIFPELQVALGAKRMEAAHRLFALGVGSAAVGAMLGCGCLWFAGPHIYAIWTEAQLTPPPLVWGTFLLGIVLNALWWTAGMTFRAANQPEGLAWAGVLGALGSVCLSWVLMRPFGLVGASLGSLALEVVMVAYALPRSCKLLDMRLFDLPKACWREILQCPRKLAISAKVTGT